MKSIKQVRAWKIGDKFYHTFDNACEMAARDILGRIDMRSSERRKKEGLPRKDVDWKFFLKWRERGFRRVRTVMEKHYNKEY